MKFDEFLDMTIKAMEKQIPKFRHQYFEQNVKDTQLVTVCPECKMGTYTNKNYKPKYCCWCGQAIGWGDTPTEKGGSEE